MVVKTITRSYSRSINTKDHGLPESWLKIESTMSADVTEEEQEHIKSLSNALFLMAKSDVTDNMAAIANRMKEDAKNRHQAPSTAPGSSEPNSINTPPPQVLARPKARL